jgi:hypothetical protein
MDRNHAPLVRIGGLSRAHLREVWEGERQTGRAARARKGAYLQDITAQKRDHQSGERFDLFKFGS